MSYLKALGVLRLIAEQKDADAAGCWSDAGCFVLHTRLDRDGLLRFFREEYRPTPIVGPWGARSGFFPGSSESAARAALEDILASPAPRLEPFRRTIGTVQDLLRGNGFTEKAKDDDKLRLMRLLRAQAPDELLPWLDAVYVLTADDRGFPPLLGTGGNEGSGSYVSGFAQQIGDVIIRREFDEAVEDALLGGRPVALGGGMTGHFNPGRLPGPNMGAGFWGGGGLNPWDYVLMMEGTLLFAGAAARRMGSDAADRAAFPFTVLSSAVGYGTAVDAEEAGDASRAEMWLPLWRRPAGLAETAHLFAEGRAQVGRRQARSGVDFARAVAGLGTDRGVTEFRRYGFLKRNGLSFIAAPLGRFAVTPHPEVRLLEDPVLEGWLDRFRRECRDAPVRYKAALRGIDRAVFGLAERTAPAGAAGHLQSVLIALGRAERAVAAAGAKFKDRLRPLHGLSQDWLRQAHDGSAEFRLAAALASVGPDSDAGVGPLRAHLEPIAADGRVEWADRSPSAVWAERPLAENLVAVLLRRMTDASVAGGKGLSLTAQWPAGLGDVADFLAGRTDDERLADLLWGLSLIDWPAAGRPEPAERGGLPPPVYALFKLSAPAVGLAPVGSHWRVSHAQSSAQVRPDPTVFRRLAGGDLHEAAGIASSRLSTAGLPVLGLRNRRRRGTAPDFAFPDPRRLAAALLFPLDDQDVTTLAGLVLHPPAEPT
jgi:CRISPR-associated protein Csx17